MSESDIRLHDLLNDNRKMTQSWANSSGLIAEAIKKADLESNPIYATFRGMDDGNMEPLAAYLATLKEGEAIQFSVLKKMIDMLRGGGGDSACEFKLVAHPASGKRGKPVTKTERFDKNSRMMKAMEVLDYEYGFQKAHRRDGVSYSPQQAIYEASQVSGMTEETIRKRLRALRALRDETVRNEMKTRKILGIFSDKYSE